MTVSAAQLLVKVNADTSAAQAGLGGLATLLGPGGVLGLGAAGAAIAIAGIGIASTKMAGDFQSGLVTLVTGAGESQSNLKLVHDGILAMATATGTSTSQLVDGMYMIESAGYHGQAGLQILQAAAEGAKVGNADLGTTADAVTTIMKDYGASGINAAQATNTLIATVANGKTHMQDLAGALANVLPTAQQAGIGLNDVMAAMAAQTAVGVPAADAATHLRQMIIALEAPSSQAKKALEDVGLSTDQVAAAMHQSLPGAIQMITDAVGKKFPVGSAAYMEAIKNISGGSREMQGILALSGSHAKDFSSDVGLIAGQVDKGGNSIQGWGQVQGTFNQKMSVLVQTIETLMIKLGEQLLPTIGQLVTWLSANLVPAAMNTAHAIQAVVTWVQHMIHFFQSTGPAATAVKAIIVILGGALLGFAASAIPAAITAIVASVTAFWAQATAAAAAAVATLAATWPFILIGAAIAAVVVIIILCVQHWGQITAALSKFGVMLQNVWNSIVGFVKNAFGALVDSLSNLWGIFIDIEVKLPLKMLSLGLSLLQNLAKGIESGIGTVAKAVAKIPLVGGVAADITKMLPHFATGGTMAETGLALVGEQGPEMVRLPAGAQVTPMSSVPAGGLAALPGGLSGGGGGQLVLNITLVSQLDGKVVGRQVLKVMPGIVGHATGKKAGATL